MILIGLLNSQNVTKGLQELSLEYHNSRPYAIGFLAATVYKDRAGKLQLTNRLGFFLPRHVQRSQLLDRQLGEVHIFRIPTAGLDADRLHLLEFVQIFQYVGDTLVLIYPLTPDETARWSRLLDSHSRRSRIRFEKIREILLIRGSKPAPTPKPHARGKAPNRE